MKGKTKFAIPVTSEATIIAGAEFEVISEIENHYICRFPDGDIIRLHKSSVIITDWTPIIDWEQRRYEIAKDIYSRILSSPDGEMRAFAYRKLDMTASDCVQEADALIEELKKQ